MNCIIFACAGSMVGLGVIFCMMNCVMIMMIGSMCNGKVSGWDRSVTHSQWAPRISMVTVEHLIEAVQEGKLDHHGQAAAQRIGAVLLVEIHDFLVLLGLARIVQLQVLVLGVDGGNLRLQGLHLTRRLHAGQPQRQQQQVDDDRDQHDGPAVVVDELIVQEMQGLEQRLGDEPEPAPID